jgi:hypothetical protein
MAAGACAGCGESFSGLTAFDKHQTTDYGSPKPVTCHDPASAGLVRDSRGRWGFPATQASKGCRTGTTITEEQGALL